jgi:signal transduction histidine kinase
VERPVTRDRPADGESVVDQKLALLAHELLNPLSVAQGYAGLALEQADADPVLRELIASVGRNVDLAVLLLQRLRDSALDDELQLETAPLDLNALVASAVQDMAATVAADHPVTFTGPPEAVPIEGDASRVRQILFNLISNAAKYSDPGAAINVTLTVGERATIEIRNHGLGVAPDDAERMFERGSRGRSTVGQGLGVGLFVSRRIAEAHGGVLHVRPAPLAGSIFILTLPLPG